MSDRLNSILQQLAQEGRVESKGVFTIAAEKVRQKLATFQFQRSGQWILKVIQALVAAGAERIELRASHTRLLIDYSCPKSPWGEAELEVAFKSPDETAGRALKHLAQALWHVSFKDGLLWSFAAARSNRSLCWTGQELVTAAASPLLEAQLIVIHNEAPLQSPWWIDASLASLAGPKWAANIAQELANYAYTCPVPLRLDGRRLDSLRLCPVIAQPRATSDILFGLESVHVASIGCGQAEAPKLKPSALTVHSKKQDILGATMVSGWWESPDLAWLSLLSVHMQRQSDSFEYRKSMKRLSSVIWVLDGVVVGTEFLPIEHGAAVTLFASAEGLALDLSGLNVVRSAPLKTRERLICQAAREWVLGQSINLRVKNDGSWLKIVQGGLALGSTVAAACGMMELAVGGVAFAIPGVTLMSAIHDTFEPGKNLFTDELMSLQSDWIYHYGPTPAA
jgi:hypothetical protein